MFFIKATRILPDKATTQFIINTEQIVWAQPKGENTEIRFTDMMIAEITAEFTEFWKALSKE